VIELRRGMGKGGSSRGLNPQRYCFLDPRNTLSHHVLEEGGSAVYYIHTINYFVRTPTVETFNPPSNFSQFKHYGEEELVERGTGKKKGRGK